MKVSLGSYKEVAQRYFWWWLRVMSTAILLTWIVVFLIASYASSLFLTQIAMYFNVFSQTTQRSPAVLALEAMTGFWSAQYTQEEEPYRWLILGTDEVEGSNRPVILTDTMLAVSVNPQSHSIKIVSFPRDLYHPEYETKINALYQYGRERSPNTPQQFPEQVLSEMLGVRFDGVITVSLADVQALIEIVKGIEVEVQNTFTDDQFPRSGVDVTVERDPKKLYETVHFEAGKQLMDGELALKYIRSRKGDNPQENSDDARSRRQKQVIASLVQKVASPYTLANPRVMGELYLWYSENVAREVPLPVLGALAQLLVKNNATPNLETIELPLTTESRATDSATLFVHPANQKYGQWVYEPVDPSWEALREFLREKGF